MDRSTSPFRVRDLPLAAGTQLRGCAPSSHPWRSRSSHVFLGNWNKLPLKTNPEKELHVIFLKYTYDGGLFRGCFEGGFVSHFVIGPIHFEKPAPFQML